MTGFVLVVVIVTLPVDVWLLSDPENRVANTIFPFAVMLRGVAVVAALVAAWRAQPEEWRREHDLRDRVPIPARRWWLVGAVLLWLALIASVGGFMPRSMAESLNAVVLLSAFILWLRGPNDPEPEKTTARWVWGKQFKEMTGRREISDMELSVRTLVEAGDLEGAVNETLQLAAVDPLAAAEVIADEPDLADALDLTQPEVSRVLLDVYKAEHPEEFPDYVPDDVYDEPLDDEPVYADETGYNDGSDYDEPAYDEPARERVPTRTTPAPAPAVDADPELDAPFDPELDAPFDPELDNPPVEGMEGSDVITRPVDTEWEQRLRK